MSDTTFFRPLADANSPIELDATSSTPSTSKHNTLLIDPMANWARTRKAPIFATLATFSFTPFFFSFVFLQAAAQEATKWHGICLESFLRIALQIFRAVYRTRPGQDGDSADPRYANPRPSHASRQSSCFSRGVAGFRCRPGGKRRGNDGSDDENNGRRRRQRNGKKPNHSRRIRVLCPFKLRYPHNHDFENCNAFTWTHLRQHLLQRKHRPRDRCQGCGDIFEDDVRWEQHTAVCHETSTQAFEPLICVTRDMVARINSLTSRGRQSSPIEELYEALWIILFGDVPVPDRTAWLRVAGDNGPQNQHSVPAAAPVEQHVPHDPAEQPESHAAGPAPSNISNMSPTQRFSEGYSPDPTCIDPALLLTPTIQPAQSTTLSNNSSEAAMDRTSSLVPSAENDASEATVGAQSLRDSEYGPNNLEDETNWVERAWIDGDVKGAG